MIPEFAQAWAERQNHLKEWFMNNPAPESHETLVEVVFNEVINPSQSCKSYNTEDMHTFTEGCYQGEEMYILPCNSGEFEDYVVTTDYYGSCSGCDSILAITGYGCHPTDEEEARELCLLALGIIQRCKYLKPVIEHEL